MLNTIQLLDAAKTNSGIESDYRLAQVLGITKAAVSAYRNGKSHPQGATARRLAELADIDPDFAMVAMQAERSPDADVRNLWERLAARLEKAGMAAMAAFLALWIGGGPDAGAMAAVPMAKPTQVAPATPVDSRFEFAHIVVQTK